MASLIKIKRSSGQAAPTSLSAGELAYSFGAGTVENGGDRLYFGNGTTIDVVGGKYFTAMLDHTPGTLTASSALVVDASSKLDNFKVDNLDFDGNTISSTNSNGDINITPNGSGKTVVKNLYIGTDSIAEYIQDIAGAGVLGGEGLTATYDDTAGTTTLAVNVDNSTIEIATDTLRVKDGSITNAKLTNSTITVSDGVATDAVALGETLTVSGSGAISTAVTANAITVSVADATVSTKGVASFATEDFTVTSGAVTIKNVNLGTQTTGNYAADVTVTAGTGLAITGTAGEGTSYVLSGVNASTTVKGVASFATANFTVTDGAVAAKDITLGTSTLTLGSTTTAVAGLTQLDVDNVRVDGNTISTTDIDGNLVLSPNGTATVVAPAGYKDRLGFGTNSFTTKEYVDGAVANASSATTLTVDGDSTTADVNLSTDDLQIRAAANLGLTSAVAKVGTDVTVTLTLAQDIRTTASPEFVGLTLSGDAAVNGGDLTTTAATFNLVNTTATTVNFAQGAAAVNIGAGSSMVTFGDDVTITGDLIVNGTTTTVNSTTLTVDDPLIKLADNNAANSLDIGFYGQYSLDAGETTKFTGFFRDASDSNKYKLFADGTVANNVVTVTTLADLVVGTLEATIDGGTY